MIRYPAGSACYFLGKYRRNQQYEGRLNLHPVRLRRGGRRLSLLFSRKTQTKQQYEACSICAIRTKLEGFLQHSVEIPDSHLTFCGVKCNVVDNKHILRGRRCVMHRKIFIEHRKRSKKTAVYFLAFADCGDKFLS